MLQPSVTPAATRAGSGFHSRDSARVHRQLRHEKIYRVVATREHVWSDVTSRGEDWRRVSSEAAETLWCAACCVRWRGIPAPLMTLRGARERRAAKDFIELTNFVRRVQSGTALPWRSHARFARSWTRRSIGSGRRRRRDGAVGYERAMSTCGRHPTSRRAPACYGRVPGYAGAGGRGLARLH